MAVQTKRRRRSVAAYTARNPRSGTGDQKLPKNLLLIHKLRKLVQVGIRNVGDGAVFHSLAAPVAPLIPLPEAGRMDGRVRLLGRHHKNINDMLAARID